ncbi:hypothetical protein [Listeria monocytogenes]|nr:hypothetical protein [Listeria monocytogenes]EXL18835.1 hypothetical protein X843_0123 [Listeria monocytogenes Lm_1840]MDN7309791.1 hypothetical protein [Listeria monocytogenes]MDN7312091.1 hypothetical protein [Listeria monocytogenes]QBZ17710.1 hypothetical protein FORC68_0482 [Listeria monocytogenes]
MNKETEQKLAASFTSKSIKILPFIPYFSQGFFGLGSSTKDII